MALRKSAAIMEEEEATENAIWALVTQLEAERAAAAARDAAGQGGGGSTGGGDSSGGANATGSFIFPVASYS